jgi:class 3 adenylate cyclase
VLFGISKGAIYGVFNIMSAVDPKAVHGAIFVCDTERFNRSARSDTDRTRIRGVLQAIIEKILKKCFKNIASKCIPSDTGDGIGIIFPAETDKAALVHDFYPALELAVKDHNQGAGKLTSFRLRAVLHFGEFFRDSPALTKNGVTGASINHAFRILDSAAHRSFLDQLAKDRPIALIISAEYYQQIIRMQKPLLTKDFSKITIKTKDRTFLAWAYHHDGKAPKVTKVAKVIKNSVSLRNAKAAPEPLVLATLPGTSILLATADIHNLNLYSRILGSIPLKNHLETSLLLGSKVILHCADPYRSRVVYNLLNEYSRFISAGKIVFLLGSSIQSVRKDYLRYLEGKSAQYKLSGVGDADVTSLLPNKVDENDVIALLEMSPVSLHRGYPGTAAFIKAVENDLEKSEKIVSYGYLDSKIRHINLTLFQLLSLQQINDRGRANNVVAKESEIEKIRSVVSQNKYHNSFSRQILLRLIMGCLKQHPLESHYGDLLELRINLLHLGINLGKRHTFTELHPQREENSPYFYRYLMEHFGILCDCAPRDFLAPDLLDELLATSEWRNFSSHHLRTMSEIYARRMADMPSQPADFFMHSKTIREFGTISRILEGHWK